MYTYIESTYDANEIRLHVHVHVLADYSLFKLSRLRFATGS